MASRPPASIASVTHAAWSRALPAVQWATLVHQLAARESLPSVQVEQDVLDSLVHTPTAYHFSLLTLAVQPPKALVRPQALLVHALRRTPPDEVCDLLIAHAQVLSLGPEDAARLLALLQDGGGPALERVAARLLVSSALPSTSTAQATALLALLRARPASARALDLERALAQALARSESASAAASAHAQPLGLEARVQGALETDVGSMLTESALADGAAEDEQAVRKMGEIVYDALAEHKAFERWTWLKRIATQLSLSSAGGADALADALLLAGLQRLRDKTTSRSFLLGQLLSLLPCLDLADPQAVVRNLLDRDEVLSLLEQIDKHAASASGTTTLSKRMEVDEDHHGGEEEHHEDSERSLPPIKLDLLDALLAAGVLDFDTAQSLGLPAPGVRHSALREGETLGFTDLHSYWLHICSAAVSPTDRQAALDVGRVQTLDWESQHVLSEVFFETWRSACAVKDIGHLASLAESLLSKEARGVIGLLLEWCDDRKTTAVEVARLGVHFLETFDEGYGDSQSTLVQYAQVSIFLQLHLRQHQFERTSLGYVDGQRVLPAMFGQAATAHPIAELSEEEKTLLNGWVSALFGPEGIADDLLQSTPPRTLAKFATTLVAQALEGHARQVLDADTLKSGLSYFSQPFLAWMSAGVVDWLVKEVRRIGGRAGAHLRVLEGLLTDPSCPSAIIELHGREVLHLVDAPGTQAVVRAAGIDTGTLKGAVGSVLGMPSAGLTASPSCSWAHALDAFAAYQFSPINFTSSDRPVVCISTLVKHLGPSTVLAAFWSALIAASIPSKGAKDRFAALIALPRVRDGGLLEAFLAQFVSSTLASSRAEERRTMEDVVRLVLSLAGRDQGTFSALVRRLKGSLESARFKDLPTGMLNTLEELALGGEGMVVG